MKVAGLSQWRRGSSLDTFRIGPRFPNKQSWSHQKPYIVTCQSLEDRRTSAEEEQQQRVILRQVLVGLERDKINKDDDRQFYSIPRLVNHCDTHFREDLQSIYSEYLGDLNKINCRGSEAVDNDDIVILDIGSSFVSHLPPEISAPKYTIIGHGMNAEELSKNPCLSRFFVRDLNKDPSGWALASESVDAALCCCSVQYFQQPEKVFAEIHRVLKPGGVCIISFTNRMFWEKAIQYWRQTNDYGRVQLVKQYFTSIDGFLPPTQVQPATRTQNKLPLQMQIERIFEPLSRGLGTSRDPFYAVIAYKSY
ncbi:hypothetical protein M9435_003520 [Picochlorum sp. BPE23]|nr:hypothetical protein M9435_003520 [Picochlorum sp. BPE23]